MSMSNGALAQPRVHNPLLACKNGLARVRHAEIRCSVARRRKEEEGVARPRLHAQAAQCRVVKARGTPAPLRYSVQVHHTLGQPLTARLQTESTCSTSRRPDTYRFFA